MKKFWFLCLILSLFFFAGCASTIKAKAAKPGDLKIYTEAYPPLNFAEKGKISGLATEVVRDLMKRTRTGADIQLVMWEEGYKAVMEKPNVALFSVAMTPERKPLLQWVGPIAMLNANFYARRGSKFGIKLLEDAKKIPNIVVVKDDYTEQFLREEGFSNLESVATAEIALRKLLTGEAQLFPCNNITIQALLKRVNATKDDVESVLNLSTNMGYIAFSKDTSPELIALWQKTLDEMKAEGAFRQIYAKWLPAEMPPGIINLMTEEYPPITFMKDGKVTGFVTDIVREISSRQGIQDNISLTSWDEAYKVALSNPNVVLFSVEKTDEREKLFQWVGPVGKNSAIFYAKKGSGIRMNSIDDARKVAAIATTSNWFTEQDLKSRGFTNLVSSPIPTDNVRKLMNQEVELSVFTDITVSQIVKNAGYSMYDMEPVFTLSNTYFYIAMSLGTPPEMVKKWQTILDEMKKDGTFEKIYRSYLPNTDMNDLLLSLPWTTYASEDFRFDKHNELLGKNKRYKVKENESLYEIARKYKTGFNEITAANPGIDPFVPENGTPLILPNSRLLPNTSLTPGIVINLSEMRLYYFFRKKGRNLVRSYPIGIGDQGANTPLGTFRVIEKIPHPAWNVPKSIRKERPELPAVVPPGPDNPMGDYALRLSRETVLIHGTDMPWGIGNRVSHGCIRLYPEDIMELFRLVPVNSRVIIVQQPVKTGVSNGRVYVEVNEDSALRNFDYLDNAKTLLKKKGLFSKVNINKLKQAVREKRGYPVNITLTK
ncbi:MAG TPA: transporter substrate-binding domain-containing protein [Candidatus Sulfobium mesophilum]|nr:transporter substrate-binding domain-containing protein [Candidatus Sulfobium mesophilum]